MRIGFLIALLGLVVAACATAPTPTATPAAPTKIAVSASSSSVASVAPTASVVSSAAATTASCTTANAAPLDKFRADDPAKFSANTGKPKLVEFFAYW